jgi:hypothetical protein
MAGAAVTRPDETWLASFTMKRGGNLHMDAFQQKYETVNLTGVPDANVARITHGGGRKKVKPISRQGLWRCDGLPAGG